MIPDYLPVLASGAHESPKDGACVMEYVSLLAGEEWSDSPACTHPVLASMARAVNDSLPDDRRQELVPLIGRLFGTADTREDATQRQVLSVRLAAWCARQVLDLAPDREKALAAIEAAEAWADEPTAERAANAAYAAAHAAANAAHAAAYAAYAAAYAAAPAAYAAHAAAYAARAVAYAASDPVALLTGLLDEYDRLTGRTESEPVDLAHLQALRAAASV